MSLSSSLFTGTSGLKNMGNALQVVGNNIANLNTVGFKKGRTIFADTLYEAVATQAGTAQMGRGMAVGSVTQNFAQGSFESTGNTTDLSIGGDGFFIVRQATTDSTYYTRAGDFYFNSDGQLVNPEGYIVQGWELDQKTGDEISSITDLILEEFTSPPEKTETITAITNLDADSNSNSVTLSNLWDSAETTQMNSGNYEYQTAIKVYDSLGSTHDISIFYDKKSGTEWEYVIAMNPEEDNRSLVQGTDAQGLLARGVITFSQSSGNILDLTMEEFTGRIGNLTASGINSTDDVHLEIVDYTAAALDGYDFNLEYDGSIWSFTDTNNDGLITSDDLPDNYPNAQIVYSDNQSIHITLTPDDTSDTDPDLKINLDQPAVAADSISFDINNATDLHVQSIEGMIYSGDAANDNTTLMINDPSVMHTDSKGLDIVWNPLTEKWYWSNPEVAEEAGTLVSGLTTNNTSSVSTDSSIIEITNAEDLNMLSSSIDIRYDGRTESWDWNEALKEEDFINETFTFSPSNDPVLTIVEAGSQGAMATASAGGEATTVTLSWDGSKWSADSGGGTTNVSIDDDNSSDTQVQLLLWEGEGTSSGASTIKYSFGSALTESDGQTISFSIDPTPPEEYANAVLVASSTTNGVAIDFDQDNTTDLVFNVTSGVDITTALVDGDSFTFDIDPDIPPVEYSNATLKGDQTQAVIDLDGSGNESDNEDIVFTFTDPLKYGQSAHPLDDSSTISFDISGSTAWKEISTDKLLTTGYFEFAVDFLGGDLGSSETKIALDIGTRFDGVNFINDSSSTTQYSKSSSTIFQDADGYASGELQGVDVATDGVITGIYSNGQLIPLFRVGLAQFLNNYGLASEGGNLFSETRESGVANTNKPGENGLGTIAPNSLEMSNVDISEEFVALITQQRGFQANSKMVTTVDDMMNTVIQMKR